MISISNAPTRARLVGQLAVAQREEHRQRVEVEADQPRSAVDQGVEDGELELDDFGELRDPDAQLADEPGEGASLRGREQLRRHAAAVLGEDHAEHVLAQGQHQQASGPPEVAGDHRGAELQRQLLQQGDAGVLGQHGADARRRRPPDDECTELGFPRRRDHLIIGEWLGAPDPPRRCRGLRCGAPQRPQLPEQFELTTDLLIAGRLDERRVDLEDDRAEGWQSSNDVTRLAEQRGGDRPGVGVQPIAVQPEPAGQVDLPHPLQRQPGDEFVDGLPAVHGVREHVVQVEQDPAVGTGGDCRGERSVVHLVGPRRQVVDAGLECQRHAELLTQPANRVDGDRHPQLGLARREEEPGVEVAGAVEAEMLADPR